MRLDHLSYAAGPGGLAGTTAALTELLGEQFVDGGVHPAFGTRNAVLPLRGGHYLEVVEVLDHPASDKSPFGQIVRARSEDGGGWVGWVIAVEDITELEQRLERSAVQGHRHRPDGYDLRWRQVGISGLQADPQLPFFLQWEIEPDQHPSAAATGDICLAKLEIAGHAERVAEWLGRPPADLVEDIDIEWSAPAGTPGLLAATFQTSTGPVRI
jgi:hypothetical protein